MSDLKPCPFCGGTKIKMYSSYSPDLHGFAHLCEINGEDMVKVESRFFETEEEAVEVWNRGVLNDPDTNVGDTISRQAAIDAAIIAVEDWEEGYGDDRDEFITYRLNELPAAQPQRMRGRWKRAYLDHVAMGERPSIFYCSACNQCIAFPTNYCPNCGADMKEGQDETD